MRARLVKTRRERAHAAYLLARARRSDDWRVLGPWLAQYLCSLDAARMSDHDIAETVRGIADAHTETEQAQADGIAQPVDASPAMPRWSAKK